eukprot:m.187884 g.187884  ORF g.187884 m.187884 type:complete len:793 (+) comp18514_c0_seq4:302-2680(+)
MPAQWNRFSRATIRATRKVLRLASFSNHVDHDDDIDSAFFSAAARPPNVTTGLLFWMAVGVGMTPMISFFIRANGSIEVVVVLLGVYVVSTIAKSIPAIRISLQRFSRTLHFKIDYWLSQLTFPRLLVFACASLLVSILGALGLLFSSTYGNDFGKALWDSAHWLVDSGALFEVSSDNVMVHMVAICTTGSGMIVFALLIGIVNDHLAGAVDDLQEGMLDVVEVNHTIILGWNDLGTSVIDELVASKESDLNGCITVLQHTFTQGALMERISAGLDDDEKGSRIICRRGDTTRISDLKSISCSSAKSIIVLAEAALEHAESDAVTVHTVLQLLHLLGKRQSCPTTTQSETQPQLFSQTKPWIVVHCPNATVYETLSLLRDRRLELVPSHVIVGRILAQAAVHQGLCDVIQELVSFDGYEIYFRPADSFVTLSFDEITCSYAGAIPIGICRGDAILLNPHRTARIFSGDRIIVIATDDSTCAEVPSQAQALAAVAREAVWNQRDKSAREDRAAPRQACLFINWHPDMRGIVETFDALVGPGSLLHIAEKMSVRAMQQLLLKYDNTPVALHNTECVLLPGDTGAAEFLGSLDLHRYDTIVVFARTDKALRSSGHAVSTVLLTRMLLALQQPSSLRSPLGSEPYLGDLKQTATNLTSGATATHKRRILVEATDTASAQMVHVTNTVDDVVHGNRITAAVLAQISENRSVSRVYTALLCSVDGGVELTLRPASLYVSRGEECSFEQIRIRARMGGATAIGFALDGDARPRINPPSRSKQRRWSANDMVLLLTRRHS